MEEALSEESESDLSPAVEETKKEKAKRRVYEKEPTISVSSDPSSEWRHQLAIMAIFCLYIFIFICCLFFIYCGVSSDGLVIAKVVRKNSTK